MIRVDSLTFYAQEKNSKGSETSANTHTPARPGAGPKMLALVHTATHSCSLPTPFFRAAKSDSWQGHLNHYKQTLDIASQVYTMQPDIDFRQRTWQVSSREEQVIFIYFRSHPVFSPGNPAKGTQVGKGPYSAHPSATYMP